MAKEGAMRRVTGRSIVAVVLVAVIQVGWAAPAFASERCNLREPVCVLLDLGSRDGRHSEEDDEADHKGSGKTPATTSTTTTVHPTTTTAPRPSEPRALDQRPTTTTTLRSAAPTDTDAGSGGGGRDSAGRTTTVAASTEPAGSGSDGAAALPASTTPAPSVVPSSLIGDSELVASGSSDYDDTLPQPGGSGRGAALFWVLVANAVVAVVLVRLNILRLDRLWAPDNNDT
jgi:hypothetical protein